MAMGVVPEMGVDSAQSESCKLISSRNKQSLRRVLFLDYEGVVVW